MKLLTTIALITLAASPILANKYASWESATCDNQQGGTTPETCCKKPSFAKYNVKFAEDPKAGSCIEVGSGVLFGWEVVVPSKDGASGPAFQVSIEPNIPSQKATNASLTLTTPICFGEPGLIQSATYPANGDFERMAAAGHNITWRFALTSVSDSSGHITYLDTIGDKPETGIWLADDCKALQQEICDGKVTDQSLKKNPFYKEAVASCGKGGGGSGAANGGGGKGGSGKGRSCNKSKRSHDHGHGSKNKC